MPLVALLAVFLLAVPLASEAQAPAKVPRIGFLTTPSRTNDPRLGAFLQGLRELGYVEGQNIAIEYRFAEGRPERLPGRTFALRQRTPPAQLNHPAFRRRSCSAKRHGTRCRTWRHASGA